MFVKIVSENGKKEEVYECKNYAFLDYGDERFLLLDRHTGRSEVNILLNTIDGTEVYIQNNEGKTIDTYRWLSETTDSVKPE